MVPEVVRLSSYDVISRRFTQASDLADHKRIHSGDEPFECNIWANLRLPLDTQKQKGIQLQGGFGPLTPHRGLCPLDPRWGLRPQTPAIGSRSALAMGFEPCAVLN